MCLKLPCIQLHTTPQVSEIRHEPDTLEPSAIVVGYGHECHACMCVGNVHDVFLIAFLEFLGLLWPI